MFILFIISIFIELFETPIIVMPLIPWIVWFVHCWYIVIKYGKIIFGKNEENNSEPIAK